MRFVRFIILACGLLHGQSSTTLQFEAASLKPAGPPGRGGASRGIVGGPGTSSPGQVAYNDQSLKNLVFIACKVQFYQLSTPAWMDEEYFDVLAKVPAGATQDDVRLMLQHLLADRFKLTMHHESRETQGYALTLGKTGSKMKASPALPADLPS